MEESVIKAASSGDKKAFKRIFDVFLPRMRPVCLRYARTSFEADDILQESFIKVHKYLSTFNYQGSFEGWIRRIVVNTALNHYKKNTNLLVTDQLETVGEELIDSELQKDVDNIEESELIKLIEKLPEGYKLVFKMYVLDDLSHKEIGEILEISEGTSRSQYAKAKKYLKKLIVQATKSAKNISY